MRLALLSALSLAIAMPAASVAENLRKGEWDYLTTAADEHSYYGRVLSRMGDQVVMKVLVTNPKDEVEKDMWLLMPLNAKRWQLNKGGK